MPQHSKAAKADSGKNTPDEALIEATRKGNKTAFAELWRRHYRSGITVAHSFTNLDADDLVSEAFVRIYKRTIEGGGPRGAFRPYLYTTIRNLASTWGTASQKMVQVDDLEVLDDAEPIESAEAPVVRGLDSDMTVKAYQSLPARWQTVLWYTEVEGLDPHEVAPLLGISANSVAALSYRAREGLRKAWLQAHVTDATASGPCAWVIERMGEHSRHSLTERESRKLEAHLKECTKCSVVCEEVDHVGSRLAFVMLPLLLGTVAAGTLLSSAAAGAGSSVAAAGLGAGVAGTAVPSLPAGITAATAGTAAAASATTVFAVAASAVVVVGAGVGTVGIVNSGAAPADTSASSAQEGALADPLGIDETDDSSTSLVPVDPSSIPTEAPPSEPVPTAPPADTSDDSTDSTDSTGSTDTTDTTDTTTDTTGDSTGTGTGTSTGTGTGTGSGKTKGTGTTLTDTTKVVTSTVDKTVTGVTGVVDGVVDGVLPEGDGLVGGLNDTLDTVTGTVNGVTTDLTGTVDSVTDLVGGLVGGLGGLLGG